MMLVNLYNIYDSESNPLFSEMYINLIAKMTEGNKKRAKRKCGR